MAEAQKEIAPGHGWWKSARLLDRADDARRYPLIATIACLTGTLLGSLADKSIAAEMARQSLSTQNRFYAHPHPMVLAILEVMLVVLIGGWIKAQKSRAVVALLSLVMGAAFGEFLYGVFSLLAGALNF
ncbi:MAG TPA: hypothetical protein VL986_06440 [Terracidiphilus sp.]|nr:hypothetical protein [Terracidiphilus sp.]